MTAKKLCPPPVSPKGGDSGGAHERKKGKSGKKSISMETIWAHTPACKNTFINLDFSEAKYCHALSWVFTGI